MEGREKSKQPKRTREALASILFMGSMVCVMLCVMLCGGCKTMGRGGGLPVPGTLSGQGMELKDINGRLYDYLQILLWVGRNNYEGTNPKNGEIGQRALDGCMEIVGLPDGNERILANNMDREKG